MFVTVGALKRLSLYMAGQLASAVAITGGTISGVTLNGAIGGTTPAAGSFTTLLSSGLHTAAGVLMSAAGSGLTLKRGANGKCGTFTADGTNPVTISNTSIAITDTICISLNTVGGTVGVQPHVATITAGTGFTVVCTASDTSVYNYAVISNAA